jgi:hypothetical protein
LCLSSMEHGPNKQIKVGVGDISVQLCNLLTR